MGQTKKERRRIADERRKRLQKYLRNQYILKNAYKLDLDEETRQDLDRYYDMKEG